MQLAAYLEKHDLSQAAFARKAGCSKAFISHIIADRRKPSPEVARAIERASDGKVPKHELRPDIWDAPKRRAA
jgi:DNA-binding transcriptional regulator YdaS (Cro superfamily)